MPGPFINYEGLYLANGVKITSGDGPVPTTNIGEAGSIHIDRTSGLAYRRINGVWMPGDEAGWAKISTSTVILPHGLGSIATAPPVASATVEHYYVDFATGNNANAGTIGSPVQYIEVAVGKVTAATGVIFIKAPSSAPYRRILSVNTTKTIWLVPWPGDADWHFYGSTQFTTGWTGPTSNVYSRTVALSSALFCVVPTLADADGLPTRLVRNTGTPTTPGLGEFGYTGGVLYVRLPGDVNPGSHTIEASNWNNAIQVTGTGTCAVVNAKVRYCASTGILNGGSSVNIGSTLIAINTETAYNGLNGIGSSNKPRLTVTYRCRSYGNGPRYSTSGDGFNVAGDVGHAHTWVALDCEASFNGDEGISPHESASLYVMGGRYHHNACGGFAGVHSSTSWLTGVLVSDNHQAGALASEGSIGVYDTATAFLDAVEVKGGKSVELFVGSSAAVYERGCRLYAGSSTTNPALI